MNRALWDVKDAGGKKPVSIKKVHDLVIVLRGPEDAVQLSPPWPTPMAAVHAGVCSTPSARDPGGSYRVM